MNIIKWARKSSPWVFHFGCGGGCNGCDIEAIAALTPRYDPERLGVKHKGSPRHADILLLTGSVSRKIKDAALRVYNQTPEPKVVVAVGNCAITGEIFRDAYGAIAPADKLFPVDVYIIGCPPKPEAVLQGILMATEKLVEKKHGEKEAKK